MNEKKLVEEFTQLKFYRKIINYICPITATNPFFDAIVHVSTKYVHVHLRIYACTHIPPGFLAIGF